MSQTNFSSGPVFVISTSWEPTPRYPTIPYEVCCFPYTPFYIKTKSKRILGALDGLAKTSTLLVLDSVEKKRHNRYFGSDQGFVEVKF